MGEWGSGGKKTPVLLNTYEKELYGKDGAHI